MNGHTIGFHPQTQKLEPHAKWIVPRAAEEIQFLWSHHMISCADSKLRTTFTINSTT